MKAFTVLSTLLAATTVLADIDPIVIKGSKFFFKTNGTEFFIQGIAYQQDAGGNGTSGGITQAGAATYKDPLADSARCQVDIPLMKKLRTNTIRVYAIDPTQNHDACMQLLISNGIYVVADLSDPGDSINRDTPQWNGALLARYTSVVDSLSSYNNVIGFFAGNEVSNQQNNTAASAFVRAAIRDTKAYIAQKKYRQMYVGYATSDDASIRINLADYFNCGDQTTAIDFWGYNIYSWCGDSSYTQSGYNQRVAEFSSYSVPAFFAEYGCNTPSPRIFTEVQAIFGQNMTPVFSGGIVYEWFQEANNYGLVSVGSATQPSILPDYSNLSSQMAKISPSGVNSASYSPTNSPQSCPAVASSTWAAKASPLPPTPNESLCGCLYNSLSCAVKGTVSSQNYATLFGTVCGLGGGSACAGIKADPSTGTYGAYSMCNATVQLSFAFDQYYKSQNSQSTACNFQGAAGVKQAVSPPSSCASLMAEAGPQGTGTVTSNPVGAAVSGSSGGSSSSKPNAAALAAPSVSNYFMALWVALLGVFGAGLLLA